MTTTHYCGAMRGCQHDGCCGHLETVGIVEDARQFVVAVVVNGSRGKPVGRHLATVVPDENSARTTAAAAAAAGRVETAAVQLGELIDLRAGGGSCGSLPLPNGDQRAGDTAGSH